MGLRRIIIARSRPLVGHDLSGKPVPTFPNHALADTAPRIELFVRQVAQSGVVGFVVGLDFRLVRTAFRACVRCMAADIGGAVDLALLRALSAHRGRRANHCRQGDASDQQSHRFTPYLSGAITKSKLRAHPVSVSGAPIVSTKIGQIFSFVQSKVPNRWLSIRRGGPVFHSVCDQRSPGFDFYSRAAPPMALSRRATSISSANRDQTCAICSITALVCTSAVVRAISRHRAANRRYSWDRPMPQTPRAVCIANATGPLTFHEKREFANAMKRLRVPEAGSVPVTCRLDGA